MYVRAVAAGKSDEVMAILADIAPAEAHQRSLDVTNIEVEEQIKDRLVKLGYRVETKLGNKNSRISLAIYDPDTDKYLVGVELDRDAIAASESAMERDVYKPRFLEARGWDIIRVWCRDWWLNPTKVIKTITTRAEKNRKK